MYYYVDKNLCEIKNFHTLNYYSLDKKVIGLSRDAFVEDGKMNSFDEMFHLKYQSVCFNLYASLYMYSTALSYKDAQELLFIQSSNNYLQSAYDNMFQLIRILDEDINKLDEVLKDITKRVKWEKNFRIENLETTKINLKYIMKLDKFFNDYLSELRFENNYVKHNGHVSIEEMEQYNHLIKLDSIKFIEGLNNGEDINSLLKDGNQIETSIYHEKSIDLEKIKSSIPIAIEKLLELLDIIMSENISVQYKEVMKITKTIHSNIINSDI